MKALRSEKIKDKVQTSLVEFTSEEFKSGHIRIATEWSGINYKDALGVTGAGLIFKKFPIVPGIDVAGTVSESQNEKFKVGDAVTVTGCGLGETHNGGYAEEVLEPEINIVKLPDTISTKEAMIYGTAGFTAALALERMLMNGQEIEMGPIVVTGASGGVGQFSTSFFAKSGFEVWAVSGKKASHERLKSLGAERVLTPEEIQRSHRPLDKAHFGGIVDNVGGTMLQELIPHVQLWGNVSCIGLASGHKLETTVMPMILRGVSLLGVSSNNCKWTLREKIWHRLANDLKPENLESFVSSEIGLDQVLEKSQELLDRKISGRILIKF